MLICEIENVNYTFEYNSTQEINGSISIVQVNNINLLQLNSLSIPINSIEIYYEPEIKIVLTSKQYMVWSVVIWAANNTQFEYLADTLLSIANNTKLDFNTTNYPRQSLVLLDNDGRMLATVETKGKLVENIPPFPSNTPIIVDAETSKITTLDEYLKQLPQTNSKTVKLARVVGSGIQIGSKLIASAMQKTTKYVVESPKPNNINSGSNQVGVSPNTIHNLNQLNKLSGKLVRVTGHASSKIKQVAADVGASLAMKSQQNNNISGQVQGNPKLYKTAKNLTQAFDEISTALEYTLIDIVGHASDSATTIVDHKYGPQATEATVEVLDVLKNATMVYVDVSGVGRKAIVTGVAKGALTYKLSSGQKVRVQPK